MLRILSLMIAITLIPAYCSGADVLTIDQVTGNAGDSNIPCFVTATHDQAIELVKSKVYAVVSHPALREIVGPDTLGTVARTNLPLPRIGAFLICLLAFHVKNPGAQCLHGGSPVLMLRFFRGCNNNACWQVGNPYGAIRCVDVLTTGT